MTKKAMWQDISRKINEKGYAYNSEQVSGRWKSLTRAYKNVKDHNKKSGNNKKSFEFESQMDDLFGDDPTIVPVVTASSRKRNDNSSCSSSRAEGSESLDDGAGPSNPKRQTKKRNKWHSSRLVTRLYRKRSKIKGRGIRQTRENAP